MIINFLKDRTYIVSLNGQKSKSFKIKSGVPQGSCLSPTLFNLYFSDISEIIPKEIYHALFADDLCIWTTNKSLKSSKKCLQIAINKISLYCKTWGLKINKSKTTYSVFTTAGYRKTYEKLNKINLTIDNSRIPLEPFPKFLGIYLDPKLSFERHFDETSKKVISKINLLKKLQSFKWKNTTRLGSTVYKSLIRPLFDYAFIPLMTGTQKVINKYEILQNRILKIIKKFPLKTRTTTILSFHKITSIKDRVSFIFKKFISSRRNSDLLPSEFNCYKTNSIQHQPTRFRTIFDYIISMN